MVAVLCVICGNMMSKVLSEEGYIVNNGYPLILPSPGYPLDGRHPLLPSGPLLKISNSQTLPMPFDL